MSGTGRHARAPVRRGPKRLSVTGTAAAAVVLTAIAAAVAVNSVGTRLAGAGAVALLPPAPVARASAVPAIKGLGRGGWSAGEPSPGEYSAAASPSPAMPLTLTTADHQDCPAAAAACVDLTRHLTWLQAGGRVAFGPVQMEPGRPGSAHQTPRGTFYVQWKGGPSLISNIYYEPMPWATFFGSDGIAFHGGSLTAWSHGCVHLTDANAHYYNEHLPLGAEVVVF